MIVVSPGEFKRLQQAVHTVESLEAWSDALWYRLVRDVLGSRCPKPYTGPHVVVVDWALVEQEVSDKGLG